MNTPGGTVGIVAVFIQLVLMSSMTSAQSRLVAFWPFDEASDTALFDESDNGNTAYIHTATRVSGVKGRALSFNGTSDYARALHSASLTITNQVSLECWVNARQVNPVSGSGQTFIRKEKAYLLGIGTGGKVGFSVCDQTGSWHGPWTLSEQSIQSSQWYHIAGIWNGQTLKVFINGIEDPASISYSGTGPSSSYTYDVYMGEFFESNYERFNGVLDELKVYNYALTPDTILAHYNASRPQPPVVLIPCVPNPTYSRRPVLRWYANKSISIYRLQIASNQGFSSVIVSLPTIDTSYTPTVDLPFGNVFWRVCNDTDTSVWSSIASVTVQDSNVPMVIPYVPDPTQNRRPLLRWHPTNGATSYSIQLSTSGDFSSPFIADAVSDTFYLTSTNFPLGTIYWRVKSNLATLFSTPDTFLILNDSIPLLIPMAPDTQFNRKPLFKWHQATSVSSYRIQIDTLGNFSSPYISLPLTADTTYSPSVDLPYGKIFWRVSASTDFTRYSPVDTFIVARSTAVKPSLRLSNTMLNGAIIHQNSHGISATFLLTQSATISLKIFTLAGTPVRTMSRGNEAAGKHTFIWDGTNGHGELLPCGNYLALCKINNQGFSKTVLLMR